MYPLHLTQPYSPCARCNVHNGSPLPMLMIFRTLGRSIYTYSTIYTVHSTVYKKNISPLVPPCVGGSAGAGGGYFPRGGAKGGGGGRPI